MTSLLTADADRICGQRIRQVFEYLKALNEHRYPAVRQIREQPWLLWLDALPNHPAIEFPQRVQCSADSDQSNTSEDREFILRVRRPVLTAAPAPPDELREWVRAGWDDPANEVEIASSRNELSSDGDTITIRFDDDPGRRAIFKTWKSKRQDWIQAELPARRAMELFDRLYALHGRLARESERLDLVVGDGLLSWQRNDGDIYHPLLLQRVQLVFDAQRPEFTIVDGDQVAEFYSGLFQAIGDVDAQAVRDSRQQFDTGGYHPLDEEVSGLLKGFVNRLSAQGSFVEKARPGTGSLAPMIGRAPVLFLRTRTRGFGTAIDQVLGSLKDRKDYCDALRNIVGCDSLGSQDDGIDDVQIVGPERPTPDVLLGKAANLEQQRIASAIDKHGSVLVQGPPGTGSVRSADRIFFRVGRLVKLGD